jgi:hypothetical protein
VSKELTLERKINLGHYDMPLKEPCEPLYAADLEAITNAFKHGLIAQEVAMAGKAKLDKRMEEYEIAKEKYRRTRENLERQFQEDLFAELDIREHTSRFLLFSKACTLAGGEKMGRGRLHGIANEADFLVGLIR